MTLLVGSRWNRNKIQYKEKVFYFNFFHIRELQNY